MSHRKIRLHPLQAALLVATITAPRENNVGIRSGLGALRRLVGSHCPGGH